jgi:hypothetical protein
MSNNYNKNPNMNHNISQGNNMLRGYHNYKMSNIPIQKNVLLNNNQNLKNRVSIDSPYDEKERLNKINHQIGRLKQLQQIKQLEKYDDLEKFMNKDTRRDAIIEPIKVNKPDDKGQKLITITQTKEGTEYNKKYLEDTYWKTRTNQPYKSALKDVMTDQEYYKKIFDKDKPEDLIIYKTTDADKIYLMDEFYEFEKILEKHDNQLKIKYSASKENEYKKEFKYNHKTRFRIKYDPSDFKKLKNNKIEYYKNEQLKLEKNKKSVEDLIDAAINARVLNDDDVNIIEFNKQSKKNTIELEEDLVNDLGEEARDLINRAIMETENKKIIKSNTLTYIDNKEPNIESEDESDNESYNDSDNNKKLKIKTNNVTINTTKQIDSSILEINTKTKIDRSKYENRKKNSESVVEQSNNSEKIKDKYRLRQKKINI